MIYMDPIYMDEFCEISMNTKEDKMNNYYLFIFAAFQTISRSESLTNLLFQSLVLNSYR